MSRFAVSEIDHVMLHLRGLGLSYSAISIILGEYHGWRMSQDNVRHRCRYLGAPPAKFGRLTDRRSAREIQL